MSKYCDICGKPLKAKITHTLKAYREKTPEDTFLVVMCDSCYELFCKWEDRQIQKEKMKVINGEKV